MNNKWIVIGICGVTNGGKSTLAKQCKKHLPNVRVISQDVYFLPEDSSRHTFIPELNHINWELLSSLDMDKMYEDVKGVLNNQIDIDHAAGDCICEKNNLVSLEDRQKLKQILKDFNVLVIEGFCIFNYEPIEKLCGLKFYLTLDRDTCFSRRVSRVYQPADVPGYFEKIVWPEHVRQLEEVQQKCKDIMYMSKTDNHLGMVFEHLLRYLKNKYSELF